MSKLAAAVSVAALVAGTAQARPGQASGIFDRSAYYSGRVSTTDDVRRVPAPVGYNGPTGSVVLRGGRLFDGTGSPPRAATIVIQGKTISAILALDDTNFPEGAVVYDVAGKTVMPGLIDLHTHLTYVEEFGRPPPLSDESVSDATLRGLDRMRIYALSGITSVRDVSSAGEVPFTLKRWQSEGRIAGPRVFPAGQLITARGGHGTEGFGLRTAPDYEQSEVREASGPDDWREAVRIQFKQGADLIKLASHYSQPRSMPPSMRRTHWAFPSRSTRRRSTSIWRSKPASTVSNTRYRAAMQRSQRW